MNASLRNNFWIGVILIVVGAVALAGNLGWLSTLGNLPGFVLFAAIAAFAFTRRRDGFGWWIVSAVFSGLALATILPNPWDDFALLGLLGSGFLLTYRDNPARWWAVIPGGVLLSLALTALVEGSTSAGTSGAVFLGGMALTFFALTRLPLRPQPWGIFPAAALGLLAILSLTAAMSWLIPAGLILAGVVLLLTQR
jgi:hypothetical protein